MFFLPSNSTGNRVVLMNENSQPHIVLGVNGVHRSERFSGGRLELIRIDSPVPLRTPSILTSSSKTVRSTPMWCPELRLLAWVFVHPERPILRPSGCYRIYPRGYFTFYVFDVTCTLATFDISECLGEDGDPIVLDMAYTLGWFREYLLGEIVTMGRVPDGFGLGPATV
jgi:hypothetical protein